MPDPLEYVVTGALLHCSEGALPMPFATHPRTTKVAGLVAGNSTDSHPLVNIPSFGICRKLTQLAGGTPVPCTPAPLPWENTYPAQMGGGAALLFRSCLRCTAGQGKIEFLTSGQLPVPPGVSQQRKEQADAAREAQAQAGKEKNAVGEAGFAEGLIPIWGSGRDLIHAAQTGDVFGVALNAAFLVWDIASVVAGVLSFGTATAAMMGAKAGLRTALKAAGKLTVHAAKKMGTRVLAHSGAVREAVQAGARATAAFVTKKCVMACFPAGTPVAVEHGYRNIEDLVSGDRVWAWDEATGNLALRPVVQTVIRHAEHLVRLRTGAHTLRATPEHPFYVPGRGWVPAGHLRNGDALLRADGQTIGASDLEHVAGADTPVYSLEVADWPTYLVGIWQLVVHNAVGCLWTLAREGVEYAQRMLKGIRFNQLMEKRLTEGVHELWLAGMKARVDTLIPGKKIISRKATQLAEISEETARKYIDELVTKYKKGKPI